MARNGEAAVWAVRLIADKRMSPPAAWSKAISALNPKSIEAAAKLCQEEHNVRERLAEDFKLTEADRHELLPSGKQRVFDGRVGWAKTYLEKAGLRGRVCVLRQYWATLE